VDGARGTGKVEDPVDFEKDRLRDVVPHKFEGGAAKEMSDVLFPAREEIVETDYFVAVTDESFAKVGTDEPGTPGDKDTLLSRIRVVGVHRHPFALIFSLPYYMRRRRRCHPLSVFC
jgi:hypothetical protein